jgi:hypothetical protein
MKNRVAWGLVVLLSTMLLAGIAVLCSPYVVLLPRQEWGFGRADIVTSEGITRDRQRFVIINDCIKLGIVAILIPAQCSSVDPQRHGAVFLKQRSRLHWAVRSSDERRRGVHCAPWRRCPWVGRGRRCRLLHRPAGWLT